MAYQVLANGCRADAIGRLIDGALQASDPSLSVRFVAADDPESEDDEYQVLRNGETLRLPSDEPGCDGATFSIQCCAWGGNYAANQHYYAGDDLKAMRDLGESRDPTAAARLIANAIKGN